MVDLFQCRRIVCRSRGNAVTSNACASVHLHYMPVKISQVLSGNEGLESKGVKSIPLIVMALIIKPCLLDIHGVNTAIRGGARQA